MKLSTLNVAFVAIALLASQAIALPIAKEAVDQVAPIGAKALHLRDRNTTRQSKASTKRAVLSWWPDLRAQRCDW